MSENSADQPSPISKISASSQATLPIVSPLTMAGLPCYAAIGIYLLDGVLLRLVQ